MDASTPDDEDVSKVDELLLDELMQEATLDSSNWIARSFNDRSPAKSRKRG